MYDVGDLIFNELDQTGRLPCDGSTFSSATYPELADVLGGTTLPDIPPQKFDIPVLIQAEEV